MDTNEKAKVEDNRPADYPASDSGPKNCYGKIVINITSAAMLSEKGMTIQQSERCVKDEELGGGVGS